MRNFLKEIFWRWKRLEDGEVPDLENYLEAALYPVDPRPAFVKDLKARLINAPVAIERTSAEAMQYALLGLAGVLSGLIIVITGIRATVTILGALGLLRHARRQVEQKGTVSA